MVVSTGVPHCKLKRLHLIASGLVLSDQLVLVADGFIQRLSGIRKSFAQTFTFSTGFVRGSGSRLKLLLGIFQLALGLVAFLSGRLESILCVDYVGLRLVQF